MASAVGRPPQSLSDPAWTGYGPSADSDASEERVLHPAERRRAALLGAIVGLALITLAALAALLLTAAVFGSGAFS
jgi:hypothetical protein